MFTRELIMWVERILTDLPAFCEKKIGVMAVDMESPLQPFIDFTLHGDESFFLGFRYLIFGPEQEWWKLIVKLHPPLVVPHQRRFPFQRSPYIVLLRNFRLGRLHVQTQRAVEVEQQEREAREKPRVQIQTRLEPECRLKNETKNFVEEEPEWKFLNKKEHKKVLVTKSSFFFEQKALDREG